jgi:hypothetical protein
MAALGEYTNVYNTALNLLVRRGYQVWYEPDTREYCAEKDGWDFRPAGQPMKEYRARWQYDSAIDWTPVRSPE